MLKTRRRDATRRDSTSFLLHPNQPSPSLGRQHFADDPHRKETDFITSTDFATSMVTTQVSLTWQCLLANSQGNYTTYSTQNINNTKLNQSILKSMHVHTYIKNTVRPNKYVPTFDLDLAHYNLKLFCLSVCRLFKSFFIESPQRL